mmetsp:Transcript_44841/g.118709  ORF Transcript_44841/g.118709 Transcript_44841/m.118709 type:complete len:256 (-) Transcript_44841:2178-2945(-)
MPRCARKAANIGGRPRNRLKAKVGDRPPPCSSTSSQNFWPTRATASSSSRPAASNSEKASAARASPHKSPYMAEAFVSSLKAMLQMSWSSTRGGITLNSASMAWATSMTVIEPVGSYCACRSKSICAKAVLLSTRMPLWNVLTMANVWIAASGRGSPVSTCLDMLRSVLSSQAKRSNKWPANERASDSTPWIPATSPSGCRHKRCLKELPKVWNTFATSLIVSSGGLPSAPGGARSRMILTAGNRGPRASPRSTL